MPLLVTPTPAQVRFHPAAVGALTISAGITVSKLQQLCRHISDGQPPRAKRRSAFIRQVSDQQVGVPNATQFDSEQLEERSHHSGQCVTAEEVDITEQLQPEQLPQPRIRHLANSLQPQGPGQNDRSIAEQALNVATSLPFVLVGYNLMRAEGHDAEVRQVGFSLVLAGSAACLYHATKPRGPQSKLRAVLRKLDYWTVSLATSSLRRAALAPPAYQQAAQMTSLSSLALVPYHPTAVTIGNCVAVELQLMRKASQTPAMRPAFRRHALALAAGGACFASESMAIRHNISCVHALWHCCAAYAVSTAAQLVSQTEKH